MSTVSYTHLDVYKRQVMLLADNTAVCPPMVYTGPQLNEIRIEGRAVGFCRGL